MFDSLNELNSLNTNLKKLLDFLMPQYEPAVYNKFIAFRTFCRTIDYASKVFLRLTP
jgi:hypothetical protein